MVTGCVRLIMSKSQGRGFQDVISQDQIHIFKRAFERCDKDKDGSIDTDEFLAALSMVGVYPSQEEIRAMMNEVPSDRIGIEDFIFVLYYYLRGADTAEELTKAFSVFDEDGDGKIDVETARSILTSLKHPIPNEQIEDVIKKLNKNRSKNKPNLIDYAEMIRELKPQ